MNNLSAKNKIMALTAAWLVVSFLMFFYFFNILDAQNRQTLNAMAQDRSNLVLLQAQDQSFKQAQADLQEMAGESSQPENFFSKDVTFVNQIQTLEALSVSYNLQMTITGISGTVDSAALAQTATPIVLVPYGLSLIGTLSNVVGFIENLENLQFVTTVTAVNISSAGKGQVNANLAAEFYLLK